VAVAAAGSGASTPPLSFLQAGCPSCRPTNSVKALKANPAAINMCNINFSSTTKQTVSLTDRNTDGNWINIDQRVFVEGRVRSLFEILWLKNVAAVTITQEPALIQLHRPICTSK